MIFVDSMFRILLTAILIPGIIGTISPSVSPSFAAEEGSLRTQEQGIRVHGNRISIDVRNAAIRDVLREIAQKAKMDVVPGDGVSGEVTIKLTDVTIEEALENLCRSRALVYEYLPDIKTYRIIRALAVGGTDEKGGGMGPKRPLPQLPQATAPGQGGHCPAPLRIGPMENREAGFLRGNRAAKRTIRRGRSTNRVNCWSE